MREKTTFLRLGSAFSRAVIFLEFSFSCSEKSWSHSPSSSSGRPMLSLRSCFSSRFLAVWFSRSRRQPTGDTLRLASRSASLLPRSRGRDLQALVPSPSPPRPSSQGHVRGEACGQLRLALSSGAQPTTSRGCGTMSPQAPCRAPRFGPGLSPILAQACPRLCPRYDRAPKRRERCKRAP